MGIFSFFHHGTTCSGDDALFQGGLWLFPALFPGNLSLCCFQAEHRTMTAFILAVIVNNYNTGQVSPSSPFPSPSPPLSASCLCFGESALACTKPKPELGNRTGILFFVISVWIKRRIGLEM